MIFEDRSLAPYQGTEAYIFLSYSHRDAEQAAEVIRNMNADGFRVWYDEGLVPGKEWDENIARAIMGCSYFVALVSQNYLDSANCRDELNYARDKKLPLLLIYLEDVQLPAGMEMRLGRMLAIHRHKYIRPELFYAKVRTADGISACRDMTGREPEPEETWTASADWERPLPAERKTWPTALKIGAPLLVLALAALLLLPRLKKSQTPQAESPAPIQTEDVAPAPDVTPTPVQQPEETEAPAPETPGPEATEPPREEPETVETPAPETPAAEPPAEETGLPEAQTEDDSQLELEQAYQQAEALREEGKNAFAALAFHKLGDYRDAQERSRALWREAGLRDTVSIGRDHALGLKEDGTAIVTGKTSDDKCNVSGWSDLVSVAAGVEHSVGLRADGTLVSKGANYKGERSLNGWEDVISVVAGDKITVAVRADGTVLAGGISDTGQCDVDDWTDIVAVAVGLQHTVGLKADGTVVAVGHNSSGQRNVSDWTDIVAIAAGSYHTVGLKADGTVVATGYNPYKQCDVDDWTDIVAIAAGKRHTVGLKSDGTVVAVGYNGDGPCNVQDWTDVIEIDCGEATTIALRSDGTALATGANEEKQCEVRYWRDLRLPFALN